MAMTRDQKRALAKLLLSKAGDIVEFWGDDETFPELSDVPSAEAAQVIAQWLKVLPGDSWDVRLPYPKGN